MKTSCGIICIRFNKNCYEALMVKKRATYSYIRFVNGRYNTKNLKIIRDLFCDMTVEEKQTILSYKFSYIFYAAYGAVTDREKLGYSRAKEKFKKLSLERIQLLMENTPSVRPLWEFPKGRIVTGEEDIECAKREFEEETKLTEYRLITDQPFVHEFEDCGVKYKYIYYYAVSDSPTRNFSIKSCPEITDLQWVSLHNAKLLVQPATTHLLFRVIHSFKKLKKKLV